MEKAKIQTEICLYPGPLSFVLYHEKHYFYIKREGGKGGGEKAGE